MKLLNGILAAALLSGCSSIAEDSRIEADQTQVPPAEALESTAQAEEVPESPESEEEYYLPVADWLVQRRTACEQDRSAIDSQLERYRDSLRTAPPEDPDEQLVVAYTQLKALMLASCQPERTPGLLNRFLSTVAAYEHWPAEYSALFDLLESEYQAYAMLEEKYRDLESRHRQTIEGIGNIERSLESEQQPRS